MLKSKVLTEDAIIFQIIDIDPEAADLEKIHQTLLSYIDPAFSSIKKKMLFMEQILDSLWNVLDSVPSEKDLVFACFIETIHPIVTNKRDYGYVTEILNGYLRNKFENLTVFSSFSEALIKLLDNFMKAPEEEQKIMYTSMCFGLTLKFINQSYENNKLDDPDFCKTPFETLIKSVSEFLLKNSNERVKGYLFKSLLEAETIELCCKFIDETILSNLLTQE